MVLIISEGLFELTVMFFSSTSSSVTFQMMMNEIIQDLINIREVVCFINNILVGIEEEKKYNEVVEEIVKMLAENNLYIKLEKCKWKIRKVRFL